MEFGGTSAIVECMATLLDNVYRHNPIERYKDNLRVVI